MRLLSVLMLGASLLSGCASYEFVGKWEKGAEKGRYVNQTQHLALTFPDPRWQIFSRPSPEMEQTGLEWQRPSSDDPTYHALFAIAPPLMFTVLSVSPLPSPLSLDEVHALLKPYLDKANPQARTLETGKLNRGGREVLRTLQGVRSPDGVEVRSLSLMFIEQQRLFELVFTTTEGLYVPKESEFWSIYDSFEYAETAPVNNAPGE